MRGYIDRGAIDILFDRREIRALSIGKGVLDSLDARSLKYVSITMYNNQSLDMLEFCVKCHETGAMKLEHTPNTYYKDTAREDEDAVKENARDILCNAIQFVNEYRLTQGYYEVSFITQKVTPKRGKEYMRVFDLTTPNAEHIDYPSLISDIVKTPKGLLGRFMDELIPKPRDIQEDDVIRESDFVPNPDGTRPWCDE